MVAIKNKKLHSMLKKSTLLKYGPAAILFLSACGISTHKLPALIALKLNIVPLQIFYVLFLVSFLKLVFDSRKNILQLLLQSLPTEIILIIMISITDAFQTHILHWFLTTLANLWALTLALYLVYIYSVNYRKNISAEKKSNKSSTKKYTWPIIFTLGIIITFHTLFGLYHLNKAAYVDERLWTYSATKRIEKYWINVLEKDWYNTRPSDKPGISLAFISGPSLLFTTPSYFKKENNPNIQELMQMLFIMRLPLLIFGSAILLLFYHIISSLVNLRVGLFATAFIGLSPILIGVGRLINPDALSWTIIPLAIFSYFSYLKTKKLGWLYLTGILLGWGILTKYIANFLFVFFLLSIFTRNLFYKNTSNPKIKKGLRHSLSALAIITLISLITFYIFYPGAWVRPERLLLGTIWSQPFEPIWQYFVIFILFLALDYFFNKSNIAFLATKLLYKSRTIIITLVSTLFFTAILLALYNVYFAQMPIDFENIISSPKTSIRAGGLILNFQAFITSFYVLIFGISPLALIGAVLASLPRWKHRKFETPNFLFIWHLFLFIMIFYVASIFSTTVPIVRYQIILYPFIFVIAAYGWHRVFLFFYKKKQFVVFYVFVAFIVLSSIFSLYSIRPYYFSYNSLVLPQKHLINLKDMGDGIYDTAQYLNNLPNAKNLNVWSDRKIVCSLFVGKCTNVTDLKEFIEDGPNYDYYVVSRGHKHKTVRLIEQRLAGEATYPLRLDKLYSDNNSPVFELRLGNRPNQYIRIIDADTLDFLVN